MSFNGASKAKFQGITLPMQQSEELPPVTRVETVCDNYFGTIVPDHYRWLEDWHSEDVQLWLGSQATYASRFLDALPERESLLHRIRQLNQAQPLLFNFYTNIGACFYLQRDPTDRVAKLVMRPLNSNPTETESEKVIFDPNFINLPAPVSAGDGLHSSIDWYVPSKNGQLIAVGISWGGSEDSTLYLVESASGNILPDFIPITRVRYGGVCWLEDGQSFFYNRLSEYSESTPLTERRYDRKMYWHLLNTPNPDLDSPIFGRNVNITSDAPHLERLDNPFLQLSSDGKWLIAKVQHGDIPEISLYTALLREVIADPASCHWRRVVNPEDAVTNFATKNDVIYLLSHQNAPNYKVVSTKLTNPVFSEATIVIAESSVVIEHILVLGKYLLTRELDSGIDRMRRLQLSMESEIALAQVESAKETKQNKAKLEVIQLPVEGTISQWLPITGDNQDKPEILLGLTSWTVSPRLYRLEVASGNLVDTNWQPPSAIDFGAIVACQVYVNSKDGTQIPLSIISKKELIKSGDNPTLLVGYGSHGIPQKPVFTPSLLAWYERGGVYAVAHVRGGGEYGAAWHEAGRKLNKQNAIDDFIACAEYLIAEGYTNPSHLAGEGGSAGGILVGGAMVARPELWAAIILRYPVTNTLRFEVSENGPSNIPEFGTVTDREGFLALKSMDCYQKVEEGKTFPGVLITAGINDKRVEVWQPAKMAAKLQSAVSKSNNNKPVLLRLDMDSGHGFGSTRQQEDLERADRFAFLLELFSLNSSSS